MPIYQPSQLHQFLESLGIAPRKGLSQNFLIDGNILRNIVSTAQVSKDDVVLEIGPGPGSLTEELLNKGAYVIAVEKDAVLAKALERLKTPERQLSIHCEDILKFPVEQALTALLPAGKKAKVIANLPYHLTTPILVQLVKCTPLFSTLVLMVQEEVARRFTAPPKCHAYSSFTLFLNYYSHPKYAFTVNSNCFYPKPKVTSAVVVLELKQPPYVSNEEGFFQLTRTAFKHRRKMLRGSLRDLYPSAAIEKALVSIGLNPLARPEDLSLEEFLQLFEKLQ